LLSMANRGGKDEKKKDQNSKGGRGGKLGDSSTLTAWLQEKGGEKKDIYPTCNP